MNRINPNALALVGFATALGAVLGSWLVGLTIGLGIVLIATFAPDRYSAPPARPRRRR